ncbi:metal-dependent hydrolase [Nannocystis bainbridge]|uniref:Metal-dependent hydrolase n=1 Tax=Nannocystis bainbridge TaxID=2995303 RepID=A0ABT5ECX7_9BACT|nr:metal-dependent hydrolase [Nannocystis bainbridge]MDC0723734.1 metal-dependent hydrolase [Nannocystis bainbridge]
MSLQVRKVQFDFADDVPFMWHPGNPTFAVMANMISILAIAFEKYIVAVVRQAMPQFTEPDVVAEADAFLRQEAQHARVHRQHLKALYRRWPGLQHTVDEAIRCFDEMLAAKSLRYHLAYIADLEATFTPTFKLFLDHEADLFRPGDDRVASMFLWHFVEEVEHRSSALILYRALGWSEAYRLAMLPSVALHMHRVLHVIVTGFNEHVPLADRQIDARVLLPGFQARHALRSLVPFGKRPAPLPDPFACVSASARKAATRGILQSQLPNHDPEDQPLPAFAAGWFDRYARGGDVAHWYSAEPS